MGIKKLIIFGAGASLLSFGASFGVGWFTRPAVIVTDLPTDSELAETPGQPSEQGESAQVLMIADDQDRTMTKKELTELVYDLRSKVEQYETKLAALEIREQRLKKSHELVNKDIERLNELRSELSSTVATVKGERNKLQNSLIHIKQVEQQNLMTIAASYDRMDAASASQILSNMSKMQSSMNGFEDAVKILHYMTDRTRGKLLGEMALTEPDLAAIFCQRLKLVEEQDS